MGNRPSVGIRDRPRVEYFVTPTGNTSFWVLADGFRAGGFDTASF